VGTETVRFILRVYCIKHNVKVYLGYSGLNDKLRNILNEGNAILGSLEMKNFPL
jgi:hypothetical protein